MYDSSPLSTAAACILLATARRLVGAGKTTDWKGKFQDPASCVALCCTQMAQRVRTNLQLENLYEHWQTIFPNCTRCLVQQHLSPTGKFLLNTFSFYGALSRSRAMTVGVSRQQSLEEVRLSAPCPTPSLLPSAVHFLLWLGNTDF